MSAYYKEIGSNLITIRPFSLYKTWNFNTSSYNITSTSSVVTFYDGPANYDINTYTTDTSGSQSGSIWYSVRYLYYGNASGSIAPYYNVFTTHSFTPSSSVIVMSINKENFGEGIIPKSFQFYNTGSFKTPYSSSGNTSSTITITDDGYGNLYDLTNTVYSASIGNVDYNRGLFIITDQSYYSYMYTASFISSSKILSTMQYTSQYTAYENQLICPVKYSEFNNTLNPTAYQNNANGTNTFKFSEMYDSSGSQIIFRPFISSIGFYDNTNQLVLIAKFAKPLRIENDMDSVFIVQYDV